MQQNERQLDRIEDKLDAVNEKLDAQSNRITKLETQGGMIKLGMTFLLPVVGWLVSKLWH